MDIRTKFVFALVAVAVVSMLALGLLIRTTADDDLRNIRLDHLEGLAEAKRAGLRQTLTGWQDRVSLIASRTQLRVSLREYGQGGDPDALLRMERILVDAIAAVDVVESLTLYDADGTLLTWEGEGPGAPLPRPLPPPPPTRDPVFQDITLIGDGALRVDYLAGLFMDGEHLGYLNVRLDAQGLLELTRNRVGLGETGETLVVLRDRTGTAQVLHTPREDGSDPLEPARPRRDDDPVNLVLDGREDRFWEGLRDITGEPVWVATSYLPENGWGIMVKVDAEEALSPIVRFKEHTWDIARALGAFAVVLGLFLGFRFARPILNLVQAADRVRKGELDARAVVTTEDEVGVLARTFNQMAEELEDQVTLLKQFQRFFDSSLDMLCIAGTDGYFKRVNPAFTRVLGWTEEELLSRSFLDFVHPEDVDTTQEEIRKLAEGIPTISFENRYQCADGTFKDLVWTSRPEPETGTIYAIARDVTESKAKRKQAKEQIETLRSRLYEAEAKLRGRS